MSATNMEDNNDFVQSFRLEADELLTQIEESVLDLEENPDNSDAINRLFRAMHTIKGSGGMFGFTELSGFTHHVETALDKVRSGNLKVSRSLIDLVLDARDLITAMVPRNPGDPAPDPQRLAATVAGLQALGGEAPLTKVEAKLKKEKRGPRVVRIGFRPFPEIYRNGLDPICILEELRTLGELQVLCRPEGVPALENLEVSLCHLAWDAVLLTESPENDIRDVFMFVEDGSTITIEDLYELGELGEGGQVPRIGELLAKHGQIQPADLRSTLEGRKLFGEDLVERGLTTDTAVAAALVEQGALAAKQAGAELESVRVPSEKLDKLINLIGELVITQAQLTQVASQTDCFELGAPVEEVERLVGELRDVVLGIRMMPIGSTFNRFRRLVRDLAGELEKDIELVTEGAETELDKGVLDRLADPLVHLIRNCVDHGIERPEARVAAGKGVKGRIRLAATRRGANVIVSVEDDGCGLNADAIRCKAIERGLISPDASLTKKEMFGLVFMPGFSTATEITKVSGRGVGMDVVKREVDALRGSIEVSSEPGWGTHVDLHLPLTLAIIAGLRVQAAGNEFVIPLSSIEECLELSSSSLALGTGRNVIKVRGEALPCVFLREQFHLRGVKPALQEAVVVRVEDARVCVVVDHVIGDHQTVIKPLGRMYRSADGFSGATILGDGSVALILDVDEIIRTAGVEEQRGLAA